MKSIRKEVLLCVIATSSVDSFGEEELKNVLDMLGDEWYVEDGQWVCTSKVEIDAKRMEVKHCLD